MCTLSPVAFHGDTIFCVTLENQPYTPAKPIVENLGLGWASQSQKLNANKERWGVTIIVIPSESGEQQTLCIPVRKLPALLASINPKKVRAELRERIELYQAECDDALWNYWMNGRAERATPGILSAELERYASKFERLAHSVEDMEQLLESVRRLSYPLTSEAARTLTGGHADGRGRLEAALEEHLDRSRRLAQELVPCARLGINIMRDLALGQGR